MKKIRILLICIIVINIILLIGLAVYNANKNSDNNGTSSVEYTTTSIEINGKLLPENYSQFEKVYNNEENSEKLYKALYDYVRSISKLNSKVKEMSAEELVKFYNENKKSITNRFYVSNAKEFTSLVENLKNAYKGEQYNHKTVILYPDTYKKYDTYVTCNIDIVLNNDSVLKYQVKIEDSNDSVKISIIPVKEV